MEEEEEEQATADGKCNGDTKKTADKKESVKPTCKGLRERASTMPQYIRAVHAQREKEKGNEVGCNPFSS